MPDLNTNDLEQLALYSTLAGSQMYQASAREANETNIRLASEARNFSAEQASKQMEFQYNMSSTAHQREIADLINAGLNPILTATGGNGASMGSGAMGSTAQAHVTSDLQGNPLENLPQSVLAARKFNDLEMEALKSNINLQNSTIATQQTQSLKNMADAELSKSGINVNSAREAQIKEESKSLGYQNIINEANTRPYTFSEANKNVLGYTNSLLPLVGSLIKVFK